MQQHQDNVIILRRTVSTNSVIFASEPESFLELLLLLACVCICLHARLYSLIGFLSAGHKKLKKQQDSSVSICSIEPPLPPSNGSFQRAHFLHFIQHLAPCHRDGESMRGISQLRVKLVLHFQIAFPSPKDKRTYFALSAGEENHG